ncbi:MULTISPECIES: hypothetical protein [Aphanothece]|uniref:hypothetical protein n=1 Tax=Aphanothece TaxID=1121 RepID=UPI0039848FBD
MPESPRPLRPLIPLLGAMASRGARLALGITAGLVALAQPTLAQRESYLLGPGSTVGPATKVKPKNCVTSPDGTITCDTELENSPSDTKARPQYEMFNN